MLGAKDLVSSRKGLESIAKRDEQYLSPDTEINNTLYHNELDFRRIQNGEKKQPNYIVVFREDGIIPNLEEAKRASEQFKGLPIVIIDVNLCLEAQQKKVEKLLKDYELNPTEETRKEICQTVINNKKRIEDSEKPFMPDFNVADFEKKSLTIERESKKHVPEKPIGEEDLSIMYDHVIYDHEENSTLDNLLEQIKRVKERNNTPIKKLDNEEKSI